MHCSACFFCSQENIVGQEQLPLPGKVAGLKSVNECCQPFEQLILLEGLGVLCLEELRKKASLNSEER